MGSTDMQDATTPLESATIEAGESRESGTSIEAAADSTQPGMKSKRTTRPNRNRRKAPRDSQTGNEQNASESQQTVSVEAADGQMSEKASRIERGDQNERNRPRKHKSSGKPNQPSRHPGGKPNRANDIFSFVTSDAYDNPADDTKELLSSTAMTLKLKMR